MLAIINAQIVLEDKILKNANLIIEGGKIVSFGENVVVPNKAKLIDAKGCFVGPGFVDIHCHGGNGARFDKNPLKAAEHFLKNGTTTILATLYYDITPYEYIVIINKVTSYLKEGKGRNNRYETITLSSGTSSLIVAFMLWLC